MGIIDAGLRACELCGGPRMTFLDYKSDAIDHFCQQCGTNDESYYDGQEDCSVRKHYRRYGVVYKVAQKGYEEIHTSFAQKPTKEEVLAVFEDLRQTEPKLKKAYGYAVIDGEWLHFDLDGTVAKSTLSDDVDQRIADYYKQPEDTTDGCDEEEDEKSERVKPDEKAVEAEANDPDFVPIDPDYPF